MRKKIYKISIYLFVFSVLTLITMTYLYERQDASICAIYISACSETTIVEYYRFFIYVLIGFMILLFNIILVTYKRENNKEEVADVYEKVVHDTSRENDLKDETKNVEQNYEDMIHKIDLAEKVSKNTFLSTGEAYSFIEIVLELIKEELAKREPVKISGFGTFEVNVELINKEKESNSLINKYLNDNVVLYKPSIVIKRAINGIEPPVRKKKGEGK